MERTASRDGTLIAYHRLGTGPPLVLVPGTGAANPIAWTAVIDALQRRFTVLAVDRRGRGGSGDGPTYAIEREFEDVAAVAAVAGERVSLLGHSFGALLALEAALQISELHKLILYEPSFPLPGDPAPHADVAVRLEALLEQGDLSELLVSHYRDLAGMSPEDLEALRNSAAWPARLATAPTLPREVRARNGYRFEAGRFTDLRVPTLILIGSESESFQPAAEAVAGALPDSRVVTLPGQQHIAMYTAPELFFSEILGFLTPAESTESRNLH